MDDLSTVDEAFRRAFGQLVTIYRSYAGTRPEALSDVIEPRAGQGNKTGIVDLEEAKGWVNDAFAREAFRELGIPNADLFAKAYRDLHEAVDGRSEATYRKMRGAS